MELCMEARALKSSLRGELAVKSTLHVLPDDHRSVAGAFSSPADDFSVDDLLDLSSGQFEAEDEDEGKNMVSIDEDGNSNVSNLSAPGDSDSFLPDELAVPEDEVAGLEWVSQFVYDSSPEWSLLYPFGAAGYRVDSVHNCQKSRTDYRFTPGSIKFANFQLSVPVKARTKRQRTNRRVWSLGPNSSLVTSSPAHLNSNEPVYGYWVKRQKKEPAVQDGGRMCMHCLVQKTPQWRTGPNGPKTLCNACGVRFKTGRLLPEYRPVSSPTFSRDIHSNSHRKVMEMRTRRMFGYSLLSVVENITP